VWRLWWKLWNTYGTATYTNFGCGFARESVETHPLCLLKEVNGSVTLMVPESLRASLGATSWDKTRAYSFILRNVRTLCDSPFLPIFISFTCVRHSSIRRDQSRLPPTVIYLRWFALSAFTSRLRNTIVFFEPSCYRTTSRFSCCDSRIDGEWHYWSINQLVARYLRLRLRVESYYFALIKTSVNYHQF